MVLSVRRIYAALVSRSDVRGVALPVQLLIPLHLSVVCARSCWLRRPSPLVGYEVLASWYLRLNLFVRPFEALAGPSDLEQSWALFSKFGVMLEPS